jgi:hypothetical protein
MAIRETPPRTPKSRLERIADHSIWWIPFVALLPASILLPEADLLPRLALSFLVVLLVGCPLSIEVRRRRADRLAKDAEDYGIIDCLIRYPKALPGSLRERWAPGSAELKHGAIVFRPINSLEPFGTDQAGAPQVHEVHSDPEQLELPRNERRMLRGRQQVIRLDTDKGVIELAADRMSLGTLTQRVYRGEKDQN